MLLGRPKIGETEEDLLRQEDELLKQSGKVSTRKRIPQEQETQTKVTDVVGEVIEKQRIVMPQLDDRVDKSKGFPTLFYIDPSVVPRKKGKKSLFALHLERNKKSVLTENSDLSKAEGDASQQSDSCEDHIAMECEEANPPKQLIDNDDIKQCIHKENLKKLSEMSEDEILEAQRKLYQTLDPKLIELLKNKSKHTDKIEPKKAPVMEDVEMSEADNVNDINEIKERLSNYVGEKWVNMDFIEKEKLEWVGDIPDAKSLEPNQPYSARFDFNGDLQPYRAEIDVTKSLHHHGDEPERPGYTIQELYQLSRSAVLQQRILAINTIAKIIRKTKLGYYDACFDGFLLHKLLESDLFILLRFSIDENALIPSVVNCLRRLLHNDTDEYCLDKLLGVGNDAQPLLFDKMETNEEEEKELKDNTIINCDLIKGVLRTDLIVRLTYILNNLPCDRETVTNAILCFIGIARHSLDSCRRIAATPNLLDFVFSVVNCKTPIYQGVKLLRILIQGCGDVAADLVAKYPMSFLISHVNSESITEIPKAEFYLLKLESVYLWRNFLRHGLMLDEFRSWTPCFIRLLRFYIEKVDLIGEGDFDFELFSAMVSLLLSDSVRDELQIDTNFLAAIQICTEKWLNQLMRSGNFNYAGLKALGSCLDFFIRYFSVYGVEQRDLRFVRKINVLFSALFESAVFETMVTNLDRFSHILAADEVKRDPRNLPSLRSVYEEGHDFLKLVNNRSSFPFFAQFVKYLKHSYFVTHECRKTAETLLRSQNVRKYVAKICKNGKNVENWFARYETSLLTDIASLFHAFDDEDTVKLCFRLLPMIRGDDENAKSVLSIMTDKKSWKSDDELFDNLLDVYLDGVFTPCPDSDLVLRYVHDLVPEEWMYSAITALRGKEAVAEIAKILKFLSFVAERNPEFLDRVPYSVRYYHLCTVFLTDSNVFDDEIQAEMNVNFRYILTNRKKVHLERKVSKNKSFYDLYTELITQYSGVSYGLHIFAKFVLFPLQNRFDVSFRKLLWFEYLHALRVVTLPHPVPDFIDVTDFAEPCETDESLLVTYLNSVSNNVISKHRNPFVYGIAVSNVKNYLLSENSDPKLANFLMHKISGLRNERLKEDLSH